MKHRPDIVVTGAICFARQNFLNDGAEGEMVHLLCDELELARQRLASMEILAAERDQLRTTVQALVAAFPRCDFQECLAAATMAYPTPEWGFFQKRCDAHPGASENNMGDEPYELKWAPIVRALQEK